MDAKYMTLERLISPSMMNRDVLKSPLVEQGAYVRMYICKYVRICVW